MAEAADLFCITKESVKFEGRDVSADHVKIPNPKPRPMNKEGLSEDYFILLQDGRTVLLGERYGAGGLVQFDRLYVDVVEVTRAI
jgi:hypothetical protein